MQNEETESSGVEAIWRLLPLINPLHFAEPVSLRSKMVPLSSGGDPNLDVYNEKVIWS